MQHAATLQRWLLKLSQCSEREREWQKQGGRERLGERATQLRTSQSLITCLKTVWEEFNFIKFMWHKPLASSSSTSSSLPSCLWAWHFDNLLHMAMAITQNLNLKPQDAAAVAAATCNPKRRTHSWEKQQQRQAREQRELGERDRDLHTLGLLVRCLAKDLSCLQTVVQCQVRAYLL